MNILYTTSLSGKRINNFYLSSILAAKSLGATFYLACNTHYSDTKLFKDDCMKYDIIPIHIPFQRNPFNPINIVAFFKLKKVSKLLDINLLHCNTVVASIISRLVFKKIKNTKVIYMAHGLHFNSRTKSIKNLMVRTVELFLLKYTDAVITINNEDYKFMNSVSRKYNVRSFYIKGVGIDTSLFLNNFLNNNKPDKDKTVIISVGELNKNKNTIDLVKALSIVDNALSIECLICGSGSKMNYLKTTAKKLKINHRIKFLGYRTDIYNLLSISDIFVMTSKREGLPVSLIEAVASSLPCIVTNIRGNRDIIIENEGGYLYTPGDYTTLAHYIESLIRNPKLQDRFSVYNKKISSQFDINRSIIEIKKIYIDTLTNIKGDNKE